MDDLESKLTDKQINAIRIGLNLGRILQREHPDIVEIWKEAGSHVKAAEVLEVQERYGVTEIIARNAVGYAISGYRGDQFTPAYDPLISKEERAAITQEHVLDCRLADAEEVNPETGERIIVEKARKGGPKGYAAGLAKRSHKERSEWRRQALLDQGIIPFTDEELEYAHQLTQNPEYQWDTPLMKGRARLELVVLELNIQIHDCEEDRNVASVSGALCRYRKKLKKVS